MQCRVHFTVYRGGNRLHVAKPVATECRAESAQISVPNISVRSSIFKHQVSLLVVRSGVLNRSAMRRVIAGVRHLYCKSAFWESVRFYFRNLCKRSDGRSSLKTAFGTVAGGFYNRRSVRHFPGLKRPVRVVVSITVTKGTQRTREECLFNSAHLLLGRRTVSTAFLVRLLVVSGSRKIRGHRLAAVGGEVYKLGGR